MSRKRKGNKFDPEYRFQKLLKRGTVPAIRPDLGECIVFLGASNGNGYRQFRYNDRNGYAHRYAWERVNGPIQGDLTVDHLCMNRSCVRIEHLELVSGHENYRRGVAARTKCNNGHDLAGNRVPGTLAMCAKCDAEGRKRRERKRWNKAGTGRDSRVRYDQKVVREQIAEVRAARSTIAQAARVIGCNPNYLGRRVWKETKDAVLKRDEGKCVRCLRPAVDAHHRRPRGSGGSSRPEIAFGMTNLVSLCRSCHTFIESHRAEALQAGWLVSKWADPSTVPIKTSRGVIRLTDHGTIITIGEKDG